MENKQEEEAIVRKIDVTPDTRAVVKYWQAAGIKTLEKQYRDVAARVYFLASTFPQMAGEDLLRLAEGEAYDEVFGGEGDD